MEHTITELHRLQGLSLNEKIEMTRERIKAWVDHWGLENCAVSFSGGKDSTVLLDIARQDYPKMEVAHVNTGLEFPEVEDFVKSYNNVTILRPKMNFVDVIRKYGYPMFSKEVAECVQGARKYLKSVLDREDEIARLSTDRQTDRQTDRLPYAQFYRKVTGTGEYSRQSKHDSYEWGGYDRKWRRVRGIGEFNAKGLQEQQRGGVSDGKVVGMADEGQSDKGEYP